MCGCNIKMQVKLFIRAFLLLLICWQPLVFAADISAEEHRLTAAQRQLVIEVRANQLTQQQVEYMQKNQESWAEFYRAHEVREELLKQVEFEQISGQSSLEGTEIALLSTREILDAINTKTSQLLKSRRQLEILGQKTYQDEMKLANVKQQLLIQEKLLKVEKERYKTLSDAQVLGRQRVEILNDRYFQLSHIYNKQISQQKLEQSAVNIAKLQDTLQKWLDKLSGLTIQLQTLTQKPGTSLSDIRKLQLSIIEANERVEMTRNDIYLLRLQASIHSLSIPPQKTHAVTYLNTLDKHASKTLQQLLATQRFILTKIKYLESKKIEYKTAFPEVEVKDFIRVLGELQQDFNQQLLTVEKLVKQTTQFKNKITALLKQQLTVRQALPPLQLEAWMALGNNLLKIPNMIWLSGQTVVQKTQRIIRNVGDWQWYALMFGFLSAVLVFIAGYRYLQRAAEALKDKRARFSANVLYIAFELVRRNIFAIATLLFLLFIHFVLGVPANLFIYLSAVFIVFKLIVTLVRLSLMETMTDVDGEDVRLFYQLKWAMIFGGILSAIIVITHSLPVTYEIKGLSNRVLMLFVLLVGLLLFRARKVLPALLDSKVTVRRRYIYHSLRLLNVLVPLAFISNAVIGLLGYVELAWLISKYQVYFLVVLVGYLITRGLLIDMFDYCSELAIRYTKHGWVWTEAVFKPLDKIARVALFLMTLVVLGHLYELDTNLAFISGLSHVMTKKLFNFVGNDINLIVIIEMVIAVMVLFWLSRWTREFSFRWIYARAKDIGVRNSLSIFTQYIAVIIGVLIGLKILGIDLTGFAVVAAAFAAGIGFGLRDMASNFFSGVLLLAERPFRVGDIVTLGEHEGRVLNIGMRSLTIRTWDRMDVIVPNADMFTKPFVNWTHQDSIVRSVIKLNVSRADNPHQIQRLIMGVLTELDGVVEQPEPEVFMKEVSDSLIEMEVRFYMMVSEKTGRAKMRSKVLFAIWDCFKVNNIQPPLEAYDIQMKNGLQRLSEV